MKKIGKIKWIGLLVVATLIFGFFSIFKTSTFKSVKVSAAQTADAPSLWTRHDFLLKGKTFEPYIRAYDKIDGNISDKAEYTGFVDTNKVGTYSLTWSVTNSRGISTTKIQIIRVVEELHDIGLTIYESPELHGVGSLLIPKGVGATWFDTPTALAELGVTATDAEGHDITSKIVIEGLEEFDPWDDRDYEITFKVTDSFGNTTSKSVTWRQEP
ncbi:immunoglobulin-like domain-containing protein [uncultured Vagococcus sp.]|uniref:immunoglobulin-like domain-containing protein n=1 Tax=uncultured Vagococcus sp. TaxID=189676 RepID=UPI0028D32D8A|nr:immunoglobulin-like domain-containing protein [uncultured Vagococcus sp.]